MDSPNPTALLNSQHRRRYFLPLLFLIASLVFSACGKTTKGEPDKSTAKPIEVKKPAPVVT